MSASIPLEGRSRLPQKVQDIVQESGNIVTQVLNNSHSNEILGSAIKGFVQLESTMCQTATVSPLKKVSLEGVIKYHL
uniref:BLOC-1-related complex subunit 7 n=1 Tax=Syphacia muris TaxID=451379 RepID=A0A0N5AIB3_9BILA